ncbi:hypothetical protein [Paracoccus sp. S4493]|uniref:hypothetical protein n=1 Tax=Paracoccus sp. S4493 TaxID=579490 RepID=UPI000B1AF0B7|nr:hypothetical protein [Paracoccus sp. S4493]
MSKRTLACIALVKPKVAALFFDRVIPFGSREFTKFVHNPIAQGYRGTDYSLDLHRAFLDGMRENREIVSELVYGDNHPGWDAVDDTIELIYSSLFDIQSRARLVDDHNQLLFVNGHSDMEYYLQIQPYFTSDELQKNELTYGENVLALDSVSSLMRKLRLPSYTFLLANAEQDSIVDTAVAPSRLDVRINLSNLPLIDESALSWHQVIEIRKDKAAKNRLLRLEKFAMDAMAAASSGGTEFNDRMEIALEDHINSCKKYSIEVSNLAISAIFNVQPALTAALAAALPAATGNHFAAAAVGATIYVSNAAVQIRQSTVLRKTFIQSQPLTFLTYDLGLKLN